MGGLMHS